MLLNGFLGGAIKTEFTYPSPTGAEVHSDHTEVLRRSSPALVAEHGAMIDRLPFLDRAAYGSRIVAAPKSFGTLIFSVLMDYTQGLYRLRDSDFVVALRPARRRRDRPGELGRAREALGLRRHRQAVPGVVRAELRVPGRRSRRALQGEHPLAGRALPSGTRWS